MPEVDYNQVWEEVSNPRFENIVPTSEHDRVSINRLQNLIQDALRLLRHPNDLSRVQNRNIRLRICQMLSRLSRERVLARRVDPTIP